MQNAIVYIGVCLIQTFVAMGIAYSGDAAVAALSSGKKDAWSTEKILTTSSGSLLAIYTAKLAYDHYMEIGDDKDEGGEHCEEIDHSRVSCNSEKSLDKKSSEMERGLVSNDCEGLLEVAKETDLPRLLSSEPGKAESLKQKADGFELEEEITGPRQEKCRQQTLFVIALIGSMDDLTLFVPMLVGKGFGCVQLMSGSLLAASAIVLMCMFVGLCKPVADFLSNVPLALIVAVFATTLLARGITMD